jgi:ABC-2 type transport system ATP-binding protein
LIEVDGLTRRFGDFVAVDSLDLQVNEGQVFGFLGPNGAGKTTTVRMLGGLIKPSEGRAVVCGIPLDQASHELRSRVGILTETPGLYERLSARRNLEIFAKLYGVRDVSGQVERYLRLLGLWDRREDPAGSFSKGMRQKLAICRALLHEPRLVFLDEPTSALDPKSSAKVREFILELRKEGRTIFLCTHNLDEAERICDKIAIFRKRVIVAATPAELRAKMYGRQLILELGSLTPEHPALLAGLGFESAIREERLLVEVKKPREEGPGIVRALVESGADIISVQEVQHSMEKMYLELIGDET